MNTKQLIEQIRNGNLDNRLLDIYIDKEKLVEDAIDGMVSSLGDVYTSYTGSEQTDEFDELVNGTYEGIGCTIQTYRLIFGLLLMNRRFSSSGPTYLCSCELEHC